MTAACHEAGTPGTGRARRAALVAGVCLLCCACGHAVEIEQRIDSVHRRIELVLGSGGYYCAPRHLALSRAHLEFARSELDQGSQARSREHLVEAELHAGAAARLSPADRCAPLATGSQSVIPSGEGPDEDQDGVPDGEDQCPAEPEDLDGHLDTDGCAEEDNDGDGLQDIADACPNQPEDKDEFEDDDGCPDADNDGDGIEDPIDRCPERAGIAAQQGCPRSKYQGLEVTDRDLRLSQPVMFEPGVATIRSVSYPILDTVVEAMNDRPDMRLEVQGHTDSQGDDAENMQLSQAQAEAVVTYLSEQGVDPARLTARGYGETRPIESNRTSQGRAINRRIEFLRTDSVP